MDARQKEIIQEITRRGLSAKPRAEQDIPDNQDGFYPLTGGKRRDFGDIGKDLIQGLANSRMAANEFLSPITEPIRKNIPEKYRFVPELKPHEFEGKNPDEITQSLTQYGLPLAAGGGDALKTVIMSALYDMTQGSPSGAPKRAAMGTLTAGTLPILAKQIMPLLSGAGKAINYFRPSQDASSFLKGLTAPGEEATAGLTSEQNIDTLAKRLAFAKQSRESEALIPKGQLMSTEAKSILPPELPQKQPNSMGIANIFSKNPTQEELEGLKPILEKYYKNGDIDEFMDKAHKNFNNPGLSESEELKIESMLPFESRKIASGSYRATKGVTDPYSSNGNLMKLHEDYMKKPNFKNSDDLISAIKSQERKYQGTKEDVGIRKLEELKRNRKALEKDQENFFDTLLPEKKNLYREFRKKYRANKEIYENKKTPVLTKLASEEPGGVKPSGVKSQFTGNLRENVKQALEDIGSSGESNILYNSLTDLKPGDVSSLVERMRDLGQSGGMGRYTEPHNALINSLEKRLKHRRYLIGSGLAGAGGLAAYGGHPNIGGTSAALGGLEAAGGSALASKLMKMLVRRF